MNSLIAVLDVVGYISTALVIIVSIIGVVMWSRGIMPALFRLGKGLSGRKIVIFAKSDHAASLENMLLDSSLFSRKNITRVSTPDDVGRAEGKTLFLVYWSDWAENIDTILRKKSDGTALIVYSPKKEGDIPFEKMIEINEYRNTIIANFRGRLINDVVVSMITTSY